MVKKKFGKSEYPVADPGEPITREKKLRHIRIHGKDRWVLVWKDSKGKLQRRFAEDHRYSSQITFSEARKHFAKRTPGQKQIDLSKKAVKSEEFPTKKWKKRPNRYDVYGIDREKLWKDDWENVGKKMDEQRKKRKKKGGKK